MNKNLRLFELIHKQINWLRRIVVLELLFIVLFLFLDLSISVKCFLLMTAVWCLANFLVTVWLESHIKKKKLLQDSSNFQSVKKHTVYMLISNVFLDVAYFGSGVFVMSFAPKEVTIGLGFGLIWQGIKLFFFDSYYLFLNRMNR